MDCSLQSFSIHGIFPGKNTGLGCHFLLQEIFLTQGMNWGLLHCRHMLYHLSHQGSLLISNVALEGEIWRRGLKYKSMVQAIIKSENWFFLSFFFKYSVLLCDSILMEVPKVSWSRLLHAFSRREEMRSRLCNLTIARISCPGCPCSSLTLYNHQTEPSKQGYGWFP